LLIFWWREADLNCRPTGYESVKAFEFIGFDGFIPAFHGRFQRALQPRCNQLIAVKEPTREAV